MKIWQLEDSDFSKIIYNFLKPVIIPFSRVILWSLRGQTKGLKNQSTFYLLRFTVIWIKKKVFSLMNVLSHFSTFLNKFLVPYWKTGCRPQFRPSTRYKLPNFFTVYSFCLSHFILFSSTLYFCSTLYPHSNWKQGEDQYVE